MFCIIITHSNTPMGILSISNISISNISISNISVSNISVNSIIYRSKRYFRIK